MEEMERSRRNRRQEILDAVDQEDFASADRLLVEANHAYPGDKYFATNLAKAELKRYERSHNRKHLDKAKNYLLAVASPETHTQELLAEVCFKRGDYAELEAMLSPLLEKKPNEWFHSHYGNALLGQAKYEQAEAHYKVCCEKWPDNTYFRSGLAKARHGNTKTNMPRVVSPSGAEKEKGGRG